jgi:hypothetical protein
MGRKVKMYPVKIQATYAKPVALLFRGHRMPLHMGLKRIASGNGYGLDKVVWEDGSSSWAEWKVYLFNKRMPKVKNQAVVTSLSGSYIATAEFDIMKDYGE